MLDRDRERIRLEHQVLLSKICRYRVAVGLEGHLTVGIERHRARDPRIKGVLGQRLQIRSFHLPGFANRHRLPVDPALVILPTLRQQMRVQFSEVLHPGNRHHVIAATESHAMLHTAFFVPRSRRAEVAGIQVMAPQLHEGLLFSTRMSGEYLTYGGLQIVVADALRHPTEKRESLHMPH